MRKTILTVCLIFFGPAILFARSTGERLTPRVDKRVELTAVAARLAGIEGFTDGLNPVYSNAIDRHFGAFRDHPLIRYLAALKPKLDEAGWEIPAVAVHLTQPPDLKPVTAFDDRSNADEWESRELFNAEFAGLLRRFYRDAKAGKFFRAQASYYEAVARSYEKQGVGIDKKRIEDFFGLKTSEDYFPILALGIRGGAYLRVNFAGNYRHTFTIFETTAFDARGLPTTFSNPYFPRMMLHEYVHAFTNQLIDEHRAELRKSAETILKNPKVFNLMKDTFYGNWRYLLYESLVRACSIKYTAGRKEFGPDIEKEIAGQEKAGFLWIRGLLKELDHYEADRARYKNLGDYMPKIVAFFEKTAAEFGSNGS